MDYKITVVTPTYNRAYTLERCYKSLCNQTNKNFIWLIIDDGSEDNTEEIIQKYRKDNIINIKYIKKNNGGKASALNKSMGFIQTKYCACLDSDEYFSNDAIEIALEELDKIKNKDNVCGIIALRRDKTGKVLGGKEIPEKVEYIKYVDINNKYNIRSEVICFYKTEILKNYKFPEFEGEKFVSPAYIQHEISRKYMYKVFRNPIIFCEYLEDGLTKNKVKVIRKNPQGYIIVIRQAFELSSKITKKIKHGIMYGAASILIKDKTFVRNSPHKLLSILLYPVSYIAYVKRFKE